MDASDADDEDSSGEAEEPAVDLSEEGSNSEESAIDPSNEGFSSEKHSNNTCNNSPPNRSLELWTCVGALGICDGVRSAVVQISD